ncbi:hypothetical protein LLE49_25270 [Alicyclobacillus tolerans]|uniref:hypothetical protein n=1 Tax=Alicyclobacillus tolerans TaxID=90970 RepID=UPI001F45F894|nr:hypothetical protein [Alicyclobacillus tolerans]MCF8568039.1 hypothetical protein [Alicyclobacillus tolerans]
MLRITKNFKVCSALRLPLYSAVTSSVSTGSLGFTTHLAALLSLGFMRLPTTAATLVYFIFVQGSSRRFTEALSI